jgi:hypothetical protein
MRSRYAFLYNGYATDRSRMVVSWESIVMLRKLAVTLAGSTIKDPYLQILVALLILVVSCVATAYVQPYETAFLNLLDIFGLFVLIFTQILSIMYFYVETATEPIGNPNVIEAFVTALLFILNVVVLLVLAAFFGIETLGLREKCKERQSNVVKVATANETKAAAAAGTVVASQWWHHPKGYAVELPPKRYTIPGEADAADLGEWVWHNKTHGIAISVGSPELLILVDGGLDALETGDGYRLMDKKTQKLHELQTKLHDVGNCCSSKSRAGLDDNEHSAVFNNDGTGASGDDGGTLTFHEGNHMTARPRIVSVNGIALTGMKKKSGSVETEVPPQANVRWSEHFDETSQASFWMNEDTRATTWVKPIEAEAALTAAKSETLPSSELWTEHFDATHQASYWSNSQTQATTWTKPPGWAAPVVDTPADDTALVGVVSIGDGSDSSSDIPVNSHSSDGVLPSERKLVRPATKAKAHRRRKVASSTNSKALACVCKCV